MMNQKNYPRANASQQLTLELPRSMGYGVYFFGKLRKAAGQTDTK